MDLHLLAFLTAASLAAVTALTLVVAVKKATRNRAECRAQARRERLAAVLANGGGDTEALARFVREVRGSAQAQEALLGVLVHEWDGVRLRYRHAFQDALRGAGLVDALVRLLGSSDPVARARAALVLGHLRLPEAVGPVAGLLDDPDGDVAHAAARALGCIGDEAAAWALVRGLQRAALAPERILEHVARSWAVDVLLTAYHIAEFGHVRAVLAEALGLAGDPRAGAALAGILQIGDEEERVRCCRALGRTADPATAPLLALALDDEAWPVRAQAARALGCAGGVDRTTVARLAAGLGDTAWWVRANCAEALLAAGDDGRAALEAALRSSDRFARERAREALELDRLRAEAAAA